MIEIVPYESSHAETWDEFCAEAPNSNFLHSRAFLSYHGDRFKDLSLLIMDSGKVLGLFPAALSLSDPAVVVCHPGITYGSLVHQGKLSGNRMVEVFRLFLNTTQPWVTDDCNTTRYLSYIRRCRRRMIYMLLCC